MSFDTDDQFLAAALAVTTLRDVFNRAVPNIAGKARDLAFSAA